MTPAAFAKLALALEGVSQNVLCGDKPEMF